MTVNVVDSQIDVFEVDSTNSDNLTNQWPLKEVRGSTGTDVQGSADLTLKSGITIDDTTFDNFPAYGFDGGSNSYAAITTKNYSASGTLSKVTVAAWINSSGFSSTEFIIGFDKDEYWALEVNSNDHVVWHTTESDGTTHSLSGSADVGDGNWHLIAGIYDTGGSPDKRIFVDGSQDASAANPHGGSSLGSGNTRFGFIGDDSNASTEDGSTAGSTYGGQMAQVFIYEGKALSNAALTDIYNAGSVAIQPDFTVPSSDIERLDISQRISKRKDSGRITLNNNNGTYDSDSNQIDSGDILRLRTRLEGESLLTHKWSAMAETILYEQLDYNRAKLRIEATDFVFGVISNRIVEDSFVDVNIFDIVDSVLSGEAPEIHRDRVQNITDSKDAYPRGTNVLDFLNEMAEKGNAVLSNSGRSLVFEKAKESRFAFLLGASDKDSHIVRYEGNSIVNEARVDGGRAIAVDDEQTIQTSTTTVTNSSRITHQLSTRKSRIQKIELYTSTTGSGEDVRIRLQQDDGGSPVAVGDSQSDIDSSLVSSDELTNGGLTPFFFSDHHLADPDPWMIIESTGSSGQDIGVDGSNNPNYKAYFNYLLSTVSADKDSQDSYRVRTVRTFHGSLRSRDAAKEVSNSIVSHGKVPDQFIEFNAQSVRAHNLKVGERIEANETNASGDFIVISKTSQYEGLNLITTLECQKVSTV